MIQFHKKNSRCSINARAFRPQQKMSHLGCMVEWDSAQKVLVFPKTDIWAKGLTKTLLNTFAPRFSAKKTARENPGEARNPSKGRKVGIRIDTLIEQWVKKGTFPQLRKASIEKSYLEAIKNKLEEKGWIPIKAQVPVGCADLKLATRIDFICQDTKTGQEILIELKCGYGSYWSETRKDQHFRKPFSILPVTLCNQALLQLCFTRYLYTHTEHQTLDSFVMHVYLLDEKPVCDLIPLPACFTDHVGEAVNIIQSASAGKKRKRTG